MMLTQDGGEQQNPHYEAALFLKSKKPKTRIGSAIISHPAVRHERRKRPE
jgi:hypothetical protein